MEIKGKICPNCGNSFNKSKHHKFCKLKCKAEWDNKKLSEYQMEHYELRSYKL